MPAPGGQLTQEREMELVALARSGNGDAFSELVAPHVRMATIMAQKIVSRREDAEDVTQNALIHAYLHIGSFEGRARFSSWFGRIIINSALMSVRRKKRVMIELGLVDLPPVTETPETLFQKAEAVRRLREAIRELPPIAREIVEARGLDELNPGEAAQRLQVPQQCAKFRYFRARKRLRRALEN